MESIKQYQEYIKNPDILQSFDFEKKIVFYKGIRDLYVSCAKKKFPATIKIVKDTLETLPPLEEVTFNQVYNMSPFPSRMHTVIYRINLVTHLAKDKKFFNLGKYFHTDSTGLQTVFVCPLDLSYHNFENIINIDSQLRFILDNNFKIEPMLPNNKANTDGIWIMPLTNTCKNLLIIDDYDLYMKPINSASRGGQRVIFNSTLLSKHIDNFIKELNIPEIVTNFSHTNTVFRYNKFEADDNKFTSHYDTPYTDDAKNKRSKYTVIIYLTAQENKNIPALKIAGNEIYIDFAPTCVIFDQKYEHEGYAYTTNPKIFIRTELIYNIDKDKLTYSPKMAKLFNIACYMTTESLYHEEFKASINDMFNRVNALRTLEFDQIDSYYNIEGPLLINIIKRIPYVTNGHNYYFLRTLNIKTAAVIMLLDYFNARCEYFGEYSYKQYRNSRVLCSNSKTDYTIKKLTKLLLDVTKELELGSNVESINKNKDNDNDNDKNIKDTGILESLQSFEDSGITLEDYGFEGSLDSLDQEDDDKISINKDSDNKEENDDNEDEDCNDKAKNKNKDKYGDDGSMSTNSSSSGSFAYVLFGYDEEPNETKINFGANANVQKNKTDEEINRTNKEKVITIKTKVELPLPQNKIIHNESLHLWKSNTLNENKATCCPTHVQNYKLFTDIQQVKKLNKLRKACVIQTQNKLAINILEYPVIIMGNTLNINIDKITVQDNVIYFGGCELNNTINFAACEQSLDQVKDKDSACNWNINDDNNGAIDTSVVRISGYKLPEINFNTYDNLIEASIDTFKNGNYIKETLTTYASAFNNVNLYQGINIPEFNKDNVNKYVNDILSSVYNNSRKFKNNYESKKLHTCTHSEAVNYIKKNVLNKEKISSIKSHVRESNEYKEICDKVVN